MLSRVLDLWEQVPDAEQRIGTGQVEVLEMAAAPPSSPGNSTAGSPSPRPPSSRSTRRRTRSAPRSCWRPGAT